MNKKAQTNNQVRIIAGDFRRQVLKFPNIQDLRPTPDRVKETVFNWLGQYFENNEICLDLFAGSGAMGAEAFSRKAQKVVFVEKNKQVLNALKENLNRINMTSLDNVDHRKIDFRHQDAFDYIQQTDLKFDVIFIDPPYRHQEYLAKLLPLLYDILNLNGKIYLESDQKFELSKEYQHQFEIIRQDKAGIVHFYLIQKIA